MKYYSFDNHLPPYQSEGFQVSRFSRWWTVGCLLSVFAFLWTSSLRQYGTYMPTSNSVVSTAAHRNGLVGRPSKVVPASQTRNVVSNENVLARDDLTGTSSPITSSFASLAAGVTAFGSMALIVLQHLFNSRSSQVAIAPIIGVAQPVDKGSDPSDEGTDARAERHRIEQRVVFNAERWRKHRAISRFSRALLTMGQSYVVGHVVKPVAAISVCTAALCAAQLYIGTDVFNLPTSLFSLSAPSLGLLLVFRTNASYERWDGARKMIGLVKNRSEDLVRQVCVRFPSDRPELKEQMLRYIQAFFFALKVHLRSGPGGFEDDTNLIEDLSPILKPKELELCLQATNRPAHIMNCMTQIVKEAKLEGGALMCLDQNLTQLADVLGGCERILRTPIPLSYTRMTTRFLFVWLLLLPLALSGEIMRLDHNIWLTVPATAFIAFGLLGVEEVGVQIEEPFSILPMEAYAAGSKNNTGGIFAQMNAVAEVTKLNQ